MLHGSFGDMPLEVMIDVTEVGVRYPHHLVVSTENTATTEEKHHASLLRTGRCPKIAVYMELNLHYTNNFQRIML